MTKKILSLFLKQSKKYYTKYNNNSKENYDLILENIKSYKNLHSESNLINTDKREKEYLLISGINNIFIDSKSINLSCLKNILEALSECLKSEINEEKKTRDNTKKEVTFADVASFYRC